jgi:hypothetical protein
MSISNSMKKLSFLLLVFITTRVYCQPDFPDSNAIWNVNYISSGGTPTHEMLYGLKGDTLINDTLYTKLYTLSDTTLSDENLQDYIGGLRLEGKIVWFKPGYWTSPDILLYDFSVPVGDTVWHNGSAYYDNSGQISFASGNNYSIIQEIILINKLKTYSIIRGADGFTDTWYEGMGSTFGLFGSVIEFPLIGDTYNMACFKNNDTVKYQDNRMCNKCFCSDWAVIDEKRNNSDWINVYPNPACNSLTIKVDKSYSKIRVDIIDEKGNIIYWKEAIESPVPFNHRYHGIYFVRVSVDNEIITKKIIIK